MNKKNIRTALSSSLKSEEESVKNRFERAESVLVGKQNENENEILSAVVHSPNDAAAPPIEVRAESKVIRDTFSITVSDYELIPALKKRCMKAGIETNKSEILRAGLIALSLLSENELIEAMERVERVKPGRPLLKS